MFEQTFPGRPRRFYWGQETRTLTRVYRWYGITVLGAFVGVCTRRMYRVA